MRDNHHLDCPEDLESRTAEAEGVVELLGDIAAFVLATCLRGA